MSKTSQSIQMLKLLYSRGIVCTQDIAEYLDTNPRNVPEYKKELENAGYAIETLPGRYGGYRLHRRGIFPVVKLTADEKDSFASACNYLYSRRDFLEKHEFDSAFSKIAATCNLDIGSYQLDAYNRFRLSMEEDKLTDIYYAVRHCLEDSLILHIEYENVHCEISTRDIHCYKLYSYNDQWFVLAYDERSKDMRYFKLNRISKFEITFRNFRILHSYRESDYLDEYGMKKHGDWHRISILMTGDNASRAKEQIYGKDQEIEVLAPDRVRLTFDFKNINNVLPMFILGLGQECQLLEPQWLIDEVVQLSKIIQNKYT